MSCMYAAPDHHAHLGPYSISHIPITQDHEYTRGSNPTAVPTRQQQRWISLPP